MGLSLGWEVQVEKSARQPYVKNLKTKINLQV